MLGVNFPRLLPNSLATGPIALSHFVAFSMLGSLNSIAKFIVALFERRIYWRRQRTCSKTNLDSESVSASGRWRWWWSSTKWKGHEREFRPPTDDVWSLRERARGTGQWCWKSIVESCSFFFANAEVALTIWSLGVQKGGKNCLVSPHLLINEKTRLVLKRLSSFIFSTLSSLSDALLKTRPKVCD